MIERVSRYYDGPLAQPKKKYTDEPTIAVFRKFPESKYVAYVEYVWKEGDTFAALSYAMNSGTKYWWNILDINPTITDPFSIEPGTKVYLPYVY